MGTGTDVSDGDTILASKMNLKLETVEAGDLPFDTWEKVYDGTVSTAASSVTVSNLTGNTDIVYLIIIHFRNADGANARKVYLRPNNDSGSNYDQIAIHTDGTTVSTSQNTSQSEITLVDAAAGDIGYGKCLLYAKSGKNRLATVHNFKPNTLLSFDGWTWTDTTNEITSLAFVCSSGSNIDVGTRIVVFKLSSDDAVSP